MKNLDTKSGLIIIENWITNLHKEMQQDSRCKPQYTNAVEGIRDSVNLLLND